VICLSMLGAVSAPVAHAGRRAAGEKGDKKTVVEARTERYDGPQARIAVGDFEVKASGASSEIGDGLREMLLTELFQSGRFIVLERQAIADVMLEQDLGASGRVKEATAAPTGKLEGAEILVYGAVSEFEAEASGGGLRLGIPGVPIKLGKKKAHLAIDLRAIDTATGRILMATRVAGEASKVSAAAAANLGGGRSEMPVGLGGFQNTPMEKAIRAAIFEAVTELSHSMPTEYFHVKR